MAHSAKSDGAKTLLLRLSVPAQGGLRAVATEFATRLAAHLGSFDGAEAAGIALDAAAERVARWDPTATSPSSSPRMTASS